MHAFLVRDPSQVCLPGPNNTVITQLGTASSVTFCEGGKMSNASLWLGITGLFLMAVLMSRSYKGPIIMGAVPQLQRVRGGQCSCRSGVLGGVIVACAAAHISPMSWLL